MMKNPPHVGEVIREEILPRTNITVAAKAMGVRRATLSDLINCKSSLSANLALKIEKAFGVSADLLLRMQAAYDATKARMMPEKTTHIKMGLPQESVDRLRALQEKIGADSIKDVLQYAVQIYEAVVNEQENGAVAILRYPDGREVRMIEDDDAAS